MYAHPDKKTVGALVGSKFKRKHLHNDFEVSFVPETNLLCIIKNCVFIL